MGKIGILKGGMVNKGSRNGRGRLIVRENGLKRGTSD